MAILDWDINRMIKSNQIMYLRQEGDGMSISERNYGLIDLHLHLDGSLSVATVRDLAAMQGIEVPLSDCELLKRLQVSENCRDLNEYLEKFSFPCSLLQTPEAIAKSVCNLQEELKSQGLLYGEIRFAPQLHLLQGLTQTEVVEAAIAGLEASDFHANLILCCMRGNDNQQMNLETVRVAAQYLGKGVCAVDLAGAEALYKTAEFEELFRLATDLSVPFTIHAGEADGPGSVRDALRFGAVRIGHGVRSVEEPALLKILKEQGITLELCPTSNLNTNMFPDLAHYPLPALMDAGVKVTVNTDNITVSNVTLRGEWNRLIAEFSLNRDQIRTLQENAVDASFASEKTKQWLRGQVADLLK